jgi:hypothetical protein
MSDGIAAPLREIKALLEDAEIPYMIVGSFASTVHGEPRTTQDLDIVIDPLPAALDHFLSHIDMDTFYVDPNTARDALRRRTMLNIIDRRSAWKIDLVMRKNRPFSREELARRAAHEILGVIVPTASAEDTIIAKLEWAKHGASERQIRDVSGILRVRGDGIDRAYILRWVQALGLEEQWQSARDLQRGAPAT